MGAEGGPAAAAAAAWLPAWPCQKAAGVRGAGVAKEEAGRVAGAWERAPNPGTHFGLSAPNKGGLWCL